MTKRVQPVRRKVRQLDWIMQWLIRVHDCPFCGKPLAEGYDKRNPGKSITLHHTEGNREVDDWDNVEYVKNMVPAHSSCHRAFHLRERMAAKGANVNGNALSAAKKGIKRSLKKNKV